MRVIEPQLSFTEQLLLNARGALRAGTHSALAPVLGAAVAPQLLPLEREVARWQRLAAVPQHTLAYCFCAVD